MVNSDGIPAVPRNRNSRNSVPNPSAEENITRNSVPWNKNRRKLAEFRSEPSAEEKITQINFAVSISEAALRRGHYIFRVPRYSFRVSRSSVGCSIAQKDAS